LAAELQGSDRNLAAARSSAVGNIAELPAALLKREVSEGHTMRLMAGPTDLLARIRAAREASVHHRLINSPQV